MNQASTKSLYSIRFFLIPFLAVFIPFKILSISVEHLIPQVIAVYPHHPAFTEGLAIKENLLYESTGLYGQSSLRQIDLLTGKIIYQISLPPKYFGEGFALVGDQLIQLTWREQVAFVYDIKNFKLIRTFPYEGEGWGLCYDGTKLFMSNGTDTITMRDPQSFAILGKYRVLLGTQSISNLNGLECIGHSLYANVWGKDFILRIDKATGIVTGVINALGLLTTDERRAIGSEGVLNGIAYNPKNKTFLLTGKYWPRIFEVQLISSNLLLNFP